MDVIAIFNKNLKVSAFIYLDNQDIAFEIINQSETKKINELVKFTKTNELTLTKEITDNNKKIIVLDPIKKENPKYLTAILETLRNQGILAAKIPKITQKTLLLIDQENFDFQTRENIISELVNLSEQDAIEMEKSVEKLLAAKNEFNENRQKWDGFLKTKVS